MSAGSYIKSMFFDYSTVWNSAKSAGRTGAALGFLGTLGAGIVSMGIVSGIAVGAVGGVASAVGLGITGMAIGAASNIGVRALTKVFRPGEDFKFKNSPLMQRIAALTGTVLTAVAALTGPSMGRGIVNQASNYLKGQSTAQPAVNQQQALRDETARINALTAAGASSQNTPGATTTGSASVPSVTAPSVALPKTDLVPKVQAADIPGFQVSQDARIGEVSIGRDGNTLTNYRMIIIGNGDDAKIMADTIVTKNLSTGSIEYTQPTDDQRLAGRTFMAINESVVLKKVLYESTVVYPAQNISAVVVQDGNNFKVTQIGEATAEQIAVVNSGKHGYRGEPYLPDPIKGIYRPKQVLTGSALPSAAKIVVLPAHEAKLNETRLVVGTNGKVSEVTQQPDGSMKATVPAMAPVFDAILRAPEAPKFDGKLISSVLQLNSTQRVALGLAALRERRA